MMGSLGWKVASLTEPLCPGSLYSNFLDAASQMLTIRSAEPAVICREVKRESQDVQWNEAMQLSRICQCCMHEHWGTS